MMLLCFVIVICSGCTGDDGPQILENGMPDINYFSSTELTGFRNQYDHFRNVESAEYVHDGIREKLDPNDPRLYRLLNAISYPRPVLHIYIESAEDIQSYESSTQPMLDIRFCEETVATTEIYSTYFNTDRLLISANGLLCFFEYETEDGSDLTAQKIYPFADYVLNGSEDDIEDRIPLIEWGDTSDIDMLTYAGFR